MNRRERRRSLVLSNQNLPNQPTTGHLAPRRRLPASAPEGLALKPSPCCDVPFPTSAWTCPAGTVSRPARPRMHTPPTFAPTPRAKQNENPTPSFSRPLPSLLRPPSSLFLPTCVVTPQHVSCGHGRTSLRDLSSPLRRLCNSSFWAPSVNEVRPLFYRKTDYHEPKRTPRHQVQNVILFGPTGR